LRGAHIDAKKKFKPRHNFILYGSPDLDGLDLTKEMPQIISVLPPKNKKSKIKRNRAQLDDLHPDREISRHFIRTF